MRGKDDIVRGREITGNLTSVFLLGLVRVRVQYCEAPTLIALTKALCLLIPGSAKNSRASPVSDWKMVERRCVGREGVKVELGHGVKEPRGADEGAAEAELRTVGDTRAVVGELRLFWDGVGAVLNVVKLLDIA